MKINRSTAFVVAVLMLLSGSAFAQPGIQPRARIDDEPPRLRPG